MGLDEAEVKKRVLWACELAGVKEKHLSKSPFDLSGGQKRRVAIAGVVAMHPKILILDEPAAGLDPKTRSKVLKSIRSLKNETDMTVILVSHSMEDIANNADRIIAMSKGRIVLDGSKSEVFSKMEELKKINLGVPQISEVFLKLRKEGYDFKEDIYTVEQAKRAVLKYIGRGDE